MFPTPVGMNRSFTLHRGGEFNVPHACGDEPDASVVDWR